MTRGYGETMLLVWRALGRRLRPGGPAAAIRGCDLAAELGLSLAEAHQAVARLEARGVLELQGRGRRRRIRLLLPPASRLPPLLAGAPARRPHWMRSEVKSPSKPAPEFIAEPVERVCLKCREAFTAEGRFNRLCPRCRGLNRRYAPAAAATGCGGRLNPARRFG